MTDRYDATLGIIGEGPETRSLHEQTDRLTHHDSVKFLGLLNEHEDVLGQMRAVQFSASPSTREGCGISCEEAMAADYTMIVADYPESAAKEVSVRRAVSSNPLSVLPNRGFGGSLNQ